MVLMWSLRSRSSQDHSHFEVKVIMESNGNEFRFPSRSGLSSECLLLLVEIATIFVFFFDLIS